ncbi:MAG: hypothetical protein JOY71_24875 [Acetobacteraceae bacterium]|nr:hypothetical protein [Acetobacteraceae bacterium]
MVNIDAAIGITLSEAPTTELCLPPNTSGAILAANISATKRANNNPGDEGLQTETRSPERLGRALKTKQLQRNDLT